MKSKQDLHSDSTACHSYAQVAGISPAACLVPAVLEENSGLSSGGKMESDEQEDVLSFLPLLWLRRVNFTDCTHDIVGWQGAAVPFSRTVVYYLFTVKLAQSMCSKPPPLTACIFIIHSFTMPS